jgi:penicillin-binding protein 1A
MALMTALKRGIDPDSTSYVSKPLKFKDPVWGDIDVKTYDGTYSGSISLTRATLKSDNSVYTQLALDLGPQAIKQTAYEMGITTHLDGYPAETLGGLTIGVSPLEMANAYATIASGGIRHRPVAITKIRLRDGTVLQGKTLPAKLRPKAEKMFQDGVTAEATRILEMNVKGGTGTKSQMGCPSAGKTGTTDKHSDAWFVGFTPRLATSVWVGYPKAQIFMTTEYHGSSVAGGTFPAEIWGDYMRKAKGGFCGEFQKPTEPLQFTKFFGKYARGGVKTDDGTGIFDPSGGSAAPTATATPGGADPKKDKGKGGKDKGNGDFDPSLYESPAQPSPTTAPPPAGQDGGASPDG